MSTGRSNLDSGGTADVAAAGSVVASMTALSRVSGFVRDIVLSHFLGAAGAADAFFVAFRIPNFFRRLFAEGAFAQAFVPVLAECRTGDRRALDDFVRAVAGNLALVLALVTLVGVLGAFGLVVVFAPGFAGDDERLALATDMLRVTFPYLAFISLTAFAGALLNSFNRYAVPAFTPVLLNLVLIGAALFAAPLFSHPAMALAWGVLFAGAAQLLFQFPSLRRLELLLAPRVDWRDPGVRKVGSLLGPAVFAASVHQLNGLISGILASLLVTGSISWLYYADRLMEVPIGLVAVALGTVLLPNLSRLHAEGDPDGFASTLDWGLRMAVLFALPAAAALFFLAVPLVGTMFHHGEFDAGDARMTALALQAFALGLPALVVVKIAAPGFFARQDTRTPFRYAAVSVGVNIVAGLALFWWLKHVGLALALGIAATVNAVLLVRGLLRRSDYAPTRALWRTVAAATVASGVMVAALAWFVPADEAWLDARAFALEAFTAGTFVASRALVLAGAVVVGLLAYAAAAYAMGVRPRDMRHRV
ncbi:MAG: murein biosynthesis integral membrane protein MurJ [Gammaproteobacteria bacterium]|nr:murein biosynthesis integral membrane protein MurJ [Gammaproteobacteria bacterium]